MPAIADSLTAQETLQSTLQAAFNDTYYAAIEATQSSFSGIDVVLQSDEPSEEERSGKPYLLLSVANDTDAPDWGFDFRSATIQADCIANDNNGGRPGASNTPVQRVMSQKLRDCIEANYIALRESGLMAIAIAGPQEIIELDSDELPKYINRHTITFHYDTV